MTSLRGLFVLSLKSLSNASAIVGFLRVFCHKDAGLAADGLLWLMIMFAFCSGVKASVVSTEVTVVLPPSDLVFVG